MHVEETLRIINFAPPTLTMVELVVQQIFEMLTALYSAMASTYAANIATV